MSEQNMKMSWTEENIEKAISILSKHKLLKDALVEMTVEFKTPVSKKALTRALERKNLKSPTMYLDSNIVKQAEVMTRPYNHGGLGMSNIRASQELSMMFEEEITVEDVTEITREIVDDNLRRRHIKAQLRTRSQLEDRMVDMREAFVKSLKALKSTPLKPDSDVNPITVSGDRPTMVIPLGDLHVGKKVKRHNNLGSYDAEVAISRLRQVSEMIKPGIYKENPERLVVVVIGDIFEALLANMRPGQQLEMDLMGQDQYIQLRDMFYEFLTDLAMQQIPTSVYFVAGNHDRLVAERTFNSEDILMHMFVDNIALNMQLVQKDFGLTTPFDVHLANRVQSLDLGHTELMFCHGHLSTVKNHDQVRRLIEVHSTTTKRKLIIQGHFHSYSAITGNNWRFVTLPSLCGSDDFARFNMNVSSPPEFMYFLCTKQHDIQVGPMSLI